MLCRGAQDKMNLGIVDHLQEGPELLHLHLVLLAAARRVDEDHVVVRRVWIASFSSWGVKATSTGTPMISAYVFSCSTAAMR